MITLVIIFVAVLIVGAALWYAIGQLAPEPVKKFLYVIVVVLAACVLAYILLGLTPGTIRFR